MVDENVVASTSTALQANATNEATASAHAATVNPGKRLADADNRHAFRLRDG